MAWQHVAEGRWKFEQDEFLTGSVAQPDAVRFAGSCDCPCGFCRPQDPHLADDGCVCRLLTCPCVDDLERPSR